MHLNLTSKESTLLLTHLGQHIDHVDAELVHTDKRDLQRALAEELRALRALTDRIRSSTTDIRDEGSPDV